MPLLDPGAERPNREPTERNAGEDIGTYLGRKSRMRQPSAAELALVGRALEDAVRTLNSPAVQQAIESFARVQREAGVAANSVAPFVERFLATMNKSLTPSVIGDWSRLQEKLSAPSLKFPAYEPPLSSIPLTYVRRPEPASAEEVAELRAELRAAHANDQEQRQRIAEMDLRLERIAKFFDDSGQTGQGQAGGGAGE